MPRRLISIIAVTTIWSSTAVAQGGQRLEACARGNVRVCQALLARPRLDPGRRAAIEFHLAELERLLGVCLAGDAKACSTLSETYPDLPDELQGKSPPAKDR